MSGRQAMNTMGKFVLLCCHFDTVFKTFCCLFSCCGILRDVSGLTERTVGLWEPRHMVFGWFIRKPGYAQMICLKRLSCVLRIIHLESNGSAAKTTNLSRSSVPSESHDDQTEAAGHVNESEGWKDQKGESTRKQKKNSKEWVTSQPKKRLGRKKGEKKKGSRHRTAHSLISVLVHLVLWCHFSRRSLYFFIILCIVLPQE